MKKLFIILLILFLTTTTFGQWSGIKPMLGRQVNWGHSLSKHIVGLWLFNEGSGNTVYDLSGNGRNCTLNGPVWYPNGIYLDGTDDQFYAADDPAWTPTNGLTVIAKLTLHTVPPSSSEGIVAHYIAAKSGGAGDAQRSWALDVSTGANLIVYLSDTGAYVAANTLTGGTTISAGDTITAAFTWNPNDSTRVYLNGVEDGSNATRPASLHNCPYPLYIGHNYYEYGHASQANMLINATFWWVYIYERALSASEIALLYREPFCMMQEDMSVTQMYNYGAAPPAGGQVIMIQMTAIPVFLILFIVVSFSMARKK